MNVVAHAYAGEPGPLTVEANPDADGLTVVVRDQGRGIRPQADVDAPSLRLGLSLIAALSSSFAISGGLDRGTEVSMRVPLRGGGADGGGTDGGRIEAVETPATTRRRFSPTARSCLPRCSPASSAPSPHAATSPVDRMSDAVLVTDAIAAAAPAGFTDGRVRLGLEDVEGAIQLRLGPMEAGAAEQIREDLRVPDVGGSLETLVDDLSVEGVGGRRVPADQLCGGCSCSLICSRIRVSARRRIRETCIWE